MIMKCNGDLDCYTRNADNVIDESCNPNAWSNNNEKDKVDFIFTPLKF